LSRFFIIKSYTEEDIHKAIKYGIWSSTANGNKVLDEAWDECEQAQTENLGDESDVYLFFSVNKSKHFCGAARMKTRVNHDRQHAELWKQPQKWPGSFKLDWITIKDIPNTQFIYLENPLNENKPACQGRDCTEIFWKVGERMLMIFEHYKATTKLYDDFKFYDEQEKFRQLKTETLAKIGGNKRQHQQSAKAAPAPPKPAVSFLFQAEPRFDGVPKVQAPPLGYLPFGHSRPAQESNPKPKPSELPASPSSEIDAPSLKKAAKQPLPTQQKKAMIWKKKD